MTQEQKQSIAQAYGDKHGYDIVTPAGVRDGYAYLDITNKSLIGRKTGLLQYYRHLNRYHSILS